MIGETREAIEAYCVAVGLLVYEWNDLHEKLGAGRSGRSQTANARMSQPPLWFRPIRGSSW